MFLHPQGEVVQIPVPVAIKALVLAATQSLVVAAFACPRGQLLSPPAQLYLLAWEPALSV